MGIVVVTKHGLDTYHNIDRHHGTRIGREHGLVSGVAPPHREDDKRTQPDEGLVKGGEFLSPRRVPAHAAETSPPTRSDSFSRTYISKT